MAGAQAPASQRLLLLQAAQGAAHGHCSSPRAQRRLDARRSSDGTPACPPNLLHTPRRRWAVGCGADRRCRGAAAGRQEVQQAALPAVEASAQLLQLRLLPAGQLHGRWGRWLRCARCKGLATRVMAHILLAG
jgi:hypothetical protein